MSFLDEAGRPTIVERAMILPPQSFMGAVDDATRLSLVQASPFYAKYSKAVDRWSAFEQIEQENETAAKEEAAQEKAQEQAQEQAALEKERAALEKQRQRAMGRRPGRPRKTALEKATDSAMTTIGREVGKSFLRTIFGTLFRSK